MNVVGVLGEKNRRLARGVPTAHDDHVLMRAHERFDVGRAVVDPQSVEALGLRKLSILRPGRNHDRAGLEPIAVFELQCVRTLGTFEPTRDARSHDLCSKLLRLVVGPAGKRLT